MIGKHFIHYQVSGVVRYYSPIEVKPFSNFIKPRYVYFGLPSKEFYVYLRDEKSASKEENHILEFKIVNDGYKITEQRVTIFNSLQIKKESETSNLELILNYEYVDHLNKKHVGKLEKSYPPSSSSVYEEIPLGRVGEVEYSIYLSVSKTYVKLISRVDYVRKK